MDRFAVTVAFLFFLFSFTTYSYAYIIVDKTFIPSDPETKTKRARPILLPSEKHESELGTVVAESDDDIATSSSSEKSTEPEKESISISFLPINHHFRFQSPRRTIRPFGPHHRCRHHHQLLKRWDPMLRGREVSYGDDMLISDGFKDVGPDPMLRDVVRQIPDRRMRFQPEVSRFPYLKEPMRWAEPREDEKTMEEEEKNHEEKHHHDHHHHEKGSFMGVRKFPWYFGY